jgi:hypothetical protein
VKELGKFLEDWEKRVPISRSTAATLGGTLIAYAETLVFERGELAPGWTWWKIAEGFRAWLPAKRPGKRKPKRDKMSRAVVLHSSMRRTVVTKSKAINSHEDDADGHPKLSCPRPA